MESPHFNSVRYRLLVLCVIAQAVTLGMTWPLWQLRDDPPHLPLFDLPQFPFGWSLILSLVVVVVRPKVGVVLHAVLLLTSFVFDQFRTQPQFTVIAVLMFAVAYERATTISRWYLGSLWFWAGLHKLLSPDWLGQRSWVLVAALGVEPQQYYRPFALTVAFAEITLGVLAAVRPRAAAVLCVVMHVGIALFLSPLARNWNYSVIPWNLCLAAVGYWILRQPKQTPGLPRTSFEAIAATFIFLLPVGFYTGHIDHGLAAVLYSDNVPNGLISNAEGSAKIEGWGRLRVPFPNERRLLRMYFERSSSPGSKLHIADPRPWLEDQYFLKQTDGSVVEVTPSRFFDDAVGAAAGVGLDSPRSIFALSRAGARLLKRSTDSMIYAVEIPPDVFDEGLLEHLVGLPNLEQLQLSGCGVSDRHLRQFGTFYNLVGIGLNNTDVTEKGLSYLAKHPRLVYIEFRDTQVIK